MQRCRLWMLVTRPCIPPIKRMGSLFDTLKQSRRIACSLCFTFQTRYTAHRTGTREHVVDFKVPPQTRCVPPLPRPSCPSCAQIPMQDAAPNCNERQASAIAELARLERASAHQRRGHACMHAFIHSSAPIHGAFSIVSTALALPCPAHVIATTSGLAYLSSTGHFHFHFHCGSLTPHQALPCGCRSLYHTLYNPGFTSSRRAYTLYPEPAQARTAS